MRLPGPVIFAFVASALVATSSRVSAAGFQNIVSSTKESSDAAQSSFAPDTPKIFVSAYLTKEAPSGSDVNSAWIAIDTGGVAPPNYKIEFSVNGKVTEKTDFTVK